jgi:hypothetical protein
VNGVLWDKSTTVQTFKNIEFRNASNQTLWYFLTQRVWDSVGNETIARGELRRSGSNLYISVRVSYSWLQGAVYPVFIDPNLSVYSSTSDGYINRFADSNYATAHDSATGTIVDTTTTSIVSQHYSAMFPWYHMYRSFEFFDTSGLGSGATLSSGNLSIWGSLDLSTTDFYITIQNGQPTYPHNPLVGGDFLYSQYSGNGGQLTTVGYSTSGYNNIPLSADGLSWVQKTGTTKFCIRSSRDINSNVPADTITERVDWYTSEQTGTANDPYLSIDYTTIAAPTLHTDVATNVLATTATLNGEITATGGENPTVTMFWGDNDGGTTPASWDFNSAPTSPAQPQGVAAFYKDVTGLSHGTLYYFSANGTNSGGTGWGSTQNFTTKPAAPTNVTATDGDFTDKVVINWTKSTGATGYYILEGSNLLDTLGDVATYDDTAAPAPTITPGIASATDGSSTAHVTLSLSGESTSNGTSRTYKVIAFNAYGNSTDSDTNTGFRGVGALTYQWYRSAADSDADFSILAGATTEPYDDTTAPAPTITPGTASATDGTSTSNITLSLSGESANVGAGRYYLCELSATGAASQNSTSDRGYRDVGALTYQWYRSLADSDADYSSLGGATTDPYDDTTAPAPTITAGNASASDGTSSVHVTLDLSNQVANNGSGRYFQCEVSATGAASQNSTPDRGYRGTDTLSYQWQRSVADLDDDYSNILGGTTDPFNDTGGVSAPDGRYYMCLVNMTGADSQNSTADRGYMATVVAPTATASNATAITGTSALAHGEITDTGYENADSRGFEWGFSAGNYTDNWTEVGSFGVGAFTYTVSELPTNTHVFWRAFAINSAGQGNSTEYDFWTLALPLAPTNLTITQVGYHTYNLSWAMGIAATTTIIRASETAYPESVTGGYPIYSGNETWLIVTGLDPDMTTYYFRAWSENEFGYSVDYDEETLANVLGLPQILFVVGLCGFAFWKKSWIRVVLSLSLIIWGVFAMPYDIKVAAPFIGLGAILFILGIIQIIASHREEQAEVT